MSYASYEEQSFETIRHLITWGGIVILAIVILAIVEILISHKRQAAAKRREEEQFRKAEEERQRRIKEIRTSLAAQGLHLGELDEIDPDEGIIDLDFGLVGGWFYIQMIDGRWCVFDDVPNGERRLLPLEQLASLRRRIKAECDGFLQEDVGVGLTPTQEQYRSLFVTPAS